MINLKKDLMLRSLIACQYSSFIFRNLFLGLNPDENALFISFLPWLILFTFKTLLEPAPFLNLKIIGKFDFSIEVPIYIQQMLCFLSCSLVLKVFTLGNCMFL